MSYPAFVPTPATGPAAAELGHAVMCASCGCRLERAEDLNGYLHFSPRAGRDANGCEVDCVDKVHDSRGKSL